MAPASKIPLVSSSAPRHRTKIIEENPIDADTEEKCKYCDFVATDREDLIRHYNKEHPYFVGYVLEEKDGSSKAFEGSVMCEVCYTKIPKSQLKNHFLQHSLDMGRSPANDAGRGGRAQMPETYPLGAPSVKYIRPLHKFIGKSTPPSPGDFAGPRESLFDEGNLTTRRNAFRGAVFHGKQRGKEGQLGMDALGPWAFEEKMPNRIKHILENDGKPRAYHRRLSVNGIKGAFGEDGNFASGVIPVVGQLLAQSKETSYAYLCDPAVVHIHKMKNEGAFCGYRNTQMFCSYLVNKKAPGFKRIKGRIPSVFEIQEHIEDAWDHGYNAKGRIETGGVRGTRKYIGTPDVEAMMEYLKIDILTKRWKSDDGKPAHLTVLSEIEQYFRSRYNLHPADTKPKVRMTSAPPIYFQHSGHSFTVIGFEKLKNGGSQLLAFDPALPDEAAVIKFVAKRVPRNLPSIMVEFNLQRYRKTTRYLQRHQIFEMLTLATPSIGTPPRPIESYSSESSDQLLDDDESSQSSAWDTDTTAAE